MAYQLAALIVQEDYSGAPRVVFEALGFPDGVWAGSVTFMEATSPQSSARMLGSNGSWTMITDSMPFVSANNTAPVGSIWSREVDGFLREASLGGKTAFGVVLSRLTGNYGFSLHRDGKHVRSFLIQRGNTLVDEGGPIPEEEGFSQAEDLERALFLLMRKLDVPFHDFESVKFEFLAFERGLED